MFLGILSRKFDFIPLFVGDILYAVLVYFGFCFLFPSKKRTQLLIISLSFCFFIEISQLIQWNWLDKIRSSTLGHYILGEGFQWTDLICYISGGIISYYLDKKGFKN